MDENVDFVITCQDWDSNFDDVRTDSCDFFPWPPSPLLKCLYLCDFPSFPSLPPSLSFRVLTITKIVAKRILEKLTNSGIFRLFPNLNVQKSNASVTDLSRFCRKCVENVWCVEVESFSWLHLILLLTLDLMDLYEGVLMERLPCMHLSMFYVLFFSPGPGWECLAGFCASGVDLCLSWKRCLRSISTIYCCAFINESLTRRRGYLSFLSILRSVCNSECVGVPGSFMQQNRLNFSRFILSGRFPQNVRVLLRKWKQFLYQDYTSFLEIVLGFRRKSSSTVHSTKHELINCLICGQAKRK